MDRSGKRDGAQRRLACRGRGAREVVFGQDFGEKAGLTTVTRTDTFEDPEGTAVFTLTAAIVPPQWANRTLRAIQARRSTGSDHVPGASGRRPAELFVRDRRERR